MTRKYQPMTETEFEENLWDVLEMLNARITETKFKAQYGKEALLHAIQRSQVWRLGHDKDWRIQPDHENFTCSSDDGALMGIRQIEGLCFLGCLAGGDWEIEVFYIIYFEGTGKTRVYVPMEGNLYCRIHKVPWGSCDDVEEDASEGLCGSAADHANDKYDWKALEDDIKKRFAP